MDKPKFQLDPERFYRTGKYLFFIIGVIGLVKLLDMWNTYKAYDVISSIASTAFQFCLFAFFSYLQGKESVKELNDGDVFEMDEALKKIDIAKNQTLKNKNGKKKSS